MFFRYEDIKKIMTNLTFFFGTKMSQFFGKDLNVIYFFNINTSMITDKRAATYVQPRFKRKKITDKITKLSQFNFLKD